MELLLVFLILSTASGLVGRSFSALTRIVIMMLAVSVTLAYALFPRLM